MEQQYTQPDSLSHVLSSLTLPGWQGGVAMLAAPWGVDIVGQPVSFYAVRRGRCELTVEAEPRRHLLEEGEFAIVANGCRHRLACDTLAETHSFDEAFSPAARTGELISLSEQTEVVYAHSARRSEGLASWHLNLPNVIRLERQHHRSLFDTPELMRWIQAEQLAGYPGQQAMVDQLVGILFRLVLRAYVVSCETTGDQEISRSILSAAMDPLIGSVVGLIHSEPGNPWTVATLAQRANMSRSAFSERFREVTGKPPLQYLTEYRMQRAGELLRDSNLGVKQIAAIVGYESPSSFTSAFKRWSSCSPAFYRKRHVDQ
ncbi:MAG: AraC family transcriptional regulator [Planctomycetales bacterium]|nr:AraC family transcriptional regulator [Planctomycetales bacterium]